MRICYLIAHQTFSRKIYFYKNLIVSYKALLKKCYINNLTLHLNIKIIFVNSISFFFFQKKIVHIQIIVPAIQKLDK